MKKQILLALFIYALPTICTEPNVEKSSDLAKWKKGKRKLNFNEITDHQSDGVADDQNALILSTSNTNIITTEFNNGTNKSCTHWHTVQRYDSPESNEKGDTGLPKPDQRAFENNPTQSNSVEVKKNNKKIKITATPINSPKNSKKNNDDKSDGEVVILSGSLQILNIINSNDNDFIYKTPEKK